MRDKCTLSAQCVSAQSPDRYGTVGMPGHSPAVFDLNPPGQRKGDLSAEHSGVRVRASPHNPLTRSHLQKLLI